jgi:peptide deformylase
MIVQAILLAGNLVLRQKAEKVSNPEEKKRLVGDLKETLLNFKKKEGIGRGIAAPQIGIMKRVVYIITNEFEGEMLNPRIIDHSEETSVWWDSCFCYKAAVFAKVRRWKGIEVEYWNLKGEIHVLKATGALSELLQHEIDHLDGILFMDRKVDEGEWIIMREEWERRGQPGEIK